MSINKTREERLVLGISEELKKSLWRVNMIWQNYFSFSKTAIGLILIEVNKFQIKELQ